MPKIRINTTDGSTLEFDLESGRARIGRAQDNDIVVPDGSVSSYHGEVSVSESGGIAIQDLGSTNGTIVNGQRVEQAEIAPGETFRLGSCEVIIVGEAVVAADAEAVISPEEEEASAAAYTEYEEEAAAPVSSGSSWASTGSVNTPAPITGLGATPAPAQLRRGFGPKAKQKDGGSSIILLGVLGLIAVVAGAVMILRMGA